MNRCSDSGTLGGAQMFASRQGRVRLRAAGAPVLLWLALVHATGCGQDRIDVGAPGLFGASGSSGICGNSILELTESCDDGNTTNGDGCNASCQIESTCGNAMVEGNEECEPPGTPNCDLACHRIVLTSRCGNGTIDPGEECEDGNAVGGDGCSAECLSEVCGNSRIDPGEECEPPNTSQCGPVCRLVPRAQCGNGLSEPGEECEDGNLLSGDGCSSTCLIELCGNGRIEAGELCEPPGTETCNARCQVVPAASRRGVCGNGVQEPGEECDDGNTFDADGCSGGCQLEVCGNGRLDPGELCEPPSTSFCDARCFLRIERCGDRVLGQNEQCDDGNAQDGDGCSSRCELEFCNNGRLDVGEECEPPGTSVCDDICRRIVRFCGNRVVDDGEDCDDGNVIDGDGCDTRCELEFCGNGRIDPGEQCELPGTEVCDANCLLNVTVCGDGVLQTGEECDDGGTFDADGCSGSCQLEVCGNGRIDAGEFCEPPGTVSCDSGCHLFPELLPAQPPNGSAPPPG